MKKTNNEGVAILMVLSAITILTFIIAQFTFDTKLNKIKIYNQVDQTQARFNAQSGLSIALAKMKIYASGRNLMEKQKAISKVISLNQLEEIVAMPFTFPIPELSNLSQIQKDLIGTFNEETLIKGKISVFTRPISSFFNPNLLRVIPSKETIYFYEKKENKDSNNRDDDNRDDDNRNDDNRDNDNRDNDNREGEDEDEKTNKALQVRRKKTKTSFEIMLELLEEELLKEKESNPNFNEIYGDIIPETLIKELQFYITPKEDYKDSLKGTFENIYEEKNIEPKHSPLTSIDELYGLAGWTDNVVNLIKDQLSVHNVTFIHINKITDKQLRFLFPNITPIQIEEFFKYRDGNEELNLQPQAFQSPEEFEALITEKLSIMSPSEYEKRMRKFKESGIELGNAGKSYKVTSTGEYNRGKYTIEAIIDIPVAPREIIKNNKKKKRQIKRKRRRKNKKKNKEQPTQFLEPRVINIKIL